MKTFGGSSDGNGFNKLGVVVLSAMSKRCIVVVCGWCNSFIGFKDGGSVVGVSHGLCPACAKQIKREGGQYVEKVC